MTQEKYPQPTDDDLAEEPLYWLGFNAFWWAIIQGKIEEIDNPALWEDYSETIEQAVNAMMLPQETP